MLVCDINKNLRGFSLDVNFAANPGTTGLMGASGSGKSMTLRCIAGISKPDRGRIELNGVVLFDSEKKINMPPQKRNTGFLFQDYALFPNMTVRQNILTGAKDKKQIIAEELAETFHIKPHLNKYPYQLSGGEKQRCALARILAGSPNILMLDEPFAALDSHLRWELEMELSELLKRFNKPVLYVSHNRSEIYRLCDNIMIMNGGKNEPLGNKKVVFKNPATVHSARLTGCKNIAAVAIMGTRISVPNWGIEFESIYAPRDISFIGIRANHIIPAAVAKKGDIAVSFPFEIVSEIEDTFTNILMVRRLGTDLPVIRWEMPRIDRAMLSEMPQELAFLHENILFLKQETKQ
jgi:molybdate transport system ATP-binding protein